MEAKESDVTGVSANECLWECDSERVPERNGK